MAGLSISGANYNRINGQLQIDKHFKPLEKKKNKSVCPPNIFYNNSLNPSYSVARRGNAPAFYR